MNKPIILRGAKAEKNTEIELTRYRALLKLDRNDLDRAAEQQSDLYMQVSDNHIEAVSARDEAKNQLALVDSELANTVRSKYERKLAEGAVYDEVIITPKHKATTAEYEQKKRLADQWGALRAAFEMRSKMIREMTQQFSSGYFSVGRVSGTPHIVRAAAAEEGRAGLHNARSGNR